MARPSRCRLRLHRWEYRENPDTHEHYQVCVRCNAYRDKGAQPLTAEEPGVSGVERSSSAPAKLADTASTACPVLASASVECDPTPRPCHACQRPRRAANCSRRALGGGGLNRPDACHVTHRSRWLRRSGGNVPSCCTASDWRSAVADVPAGTFPASSSAETWWSAELILRRLKSLHCLMPPAASNSPSSSNKVQVERAADARHFGCRVFAYAAAGLWVERLVGLDNDNCHARVRARLVALSGCPDKHVPGGAGVLDLILAGDPSRPADHSEQLPKGASVTAEHRFGVVVGDVGSARKIVTTQEFLHRHAPGGPP